MLKCWRSVRSFIVRDDGPTAVEYAILGVLVLGVIIGVVALLGQDTGKSYNNSATKISSGR